MNTFATTQSASRRALRTKARKLGTPRASLGAFAVTAIVAAAAASAGAFGTFTSSTNGSQNVASGTVVIGLGDGSATANDFSVDAADIAPGDSIYRVVDLLDTGSIDLQDVTLTTTATTSSLLNTDATNGLQLVVDQCSVPWTADGSGDPQSYSCGGTTKHLIASSAVIQSATSLGATLNALTAGATSHLLVKLSLPGTADDTFQGLSSTIKYTFDATQRTTAHNQ